MAELKTDTENVPNEVQTQLDVARRVATSKGVKNRRLRLLEMKQVKERRKNLKVERKKRRKQGLPKQVPRTIENTRESDVTTLARGGGEDEEEDEELLTDIRLNEFSSYFQRKYTPKVLITYSDNPLTRTRIFGRELSRVIPNSVTRYRNRSGVKKIVESCKREDFSDIIIINENQRQPNGMMIIHLPDGPTANFRLSNVKITPDLRKNYREISEMRPEVVLNNFTTRLGHTVASMLACLFNHDPQFRGRRAVTFHNQRDYIFFRHHMYQFRSSEKVSLKELGPRFTLKLRSLQHGTFDSRTGEYEWDKSVRRHEMETSRRRFFL